MVRYLKTIILFTLAVVFLMQGTAFSYSSNQSSQARKNWRKWKIDEKNYKGDIVKQRVIKFDRNSIRQPYEFSSPAFDGKRIYIGVHDKKFYAVGIKPRRKVWTANTVGEIETEAALSGDKVFIGDSDGYIFAFDKNNGKQLWQANILEPVASAPMSDNNILYLISSTGRIFAFNEETGSEIWHSMPHERTIGFSLHTSPPPVIIGENLFIGTPSGRIISYDKQGKKNWEAIVGDESADINDIGDITSDGTNLFVTVSDGRVLSLNSNTGEIIWEFDIDSANSLSLCNPNQLFVTGNNVIYSLNPKTGLPSWSHEFENIPGLSPPTCSTDYVAVSSTNKQLYILAIDDGEIVLNRFLRGGSYTRPLIENDVVYVLSNASRLYSFKVSVKPRNKK